MFSRTKAIHLRGPKRSPYHGEKIAIGQVIPTKAKATITIGMAKVKARAKAAPKEKVLVRIMEGRVQNCLAKA